MSVIFFLLVCPGAFPFLPLPLSPRSPVLESLFLDHSKGSRTLETGLRLFPGIRKQCPLPSFLFYGMPCTVFRPSPLRPVPFLFSVVSFFFPFLVVTLENRITCGWSGNSITQHLYSIWRISKLSFIFLFECMFCESAFLHSCFFSIYLLLNLLF